MSSVLHHYCQKEILSCLTYSVFGNQAKGVGILVGKLEYSYADSNTVTGIPVPFSFPIRGTVHFVTASSVAIQMNWVMPSHKFYSFSIFCSIVGFTFITLLPFYCFLKSSRLNIVPLTPFQQTWRESRGLFLLTTSNVSKFKMISLFLLNSMLKPPFLF